MEVKNCHKFPKKKYKNQHTIKPPTNAGKKIQELKKNLIEKIGTNQILILNDED